MEEFSEQEPRPKYGSEYITLQSVVVEQDALIFLFANGDDVRLDFDSLETLVPEGTTNVKWTLATVDEQGLYIKVPASPENLEIPWEVIRKVTDTGFSASVDTFTLEQYRKTGKLIKNERERRGVSLEDLASKLGVTKEELHQIENGDPMINDHIANIVDLFGTDFLFPK